MLFMYVYFYSLHVSGSHVPIIRRINCINTTSCVCHSVYMTVWPAGLNESKILQISYVWGEFWPLEPIIKLTMVCNWKLTFILGLFLPYEPFSLKEWNPCSVGLLHILKSLDSSASCREFIIEWVVEERVTLHVPAALRRQQLHRCTERRYKTNPWGCWCDPRQPVHMLRPGWCGNH
jgi:hypothetical protein